MSEAATNLLPLPFSRLKEKETDSLKRNVHLRRGRGGGCSSARGSRFGSLSFPSQSGPSDGKGKEYSLILHFHGEFLTLSFRPPRGSDQFQEYGKARGGPHRAVAVTCHLSALGGPSS